MGKKKLLFVMPSLSAGGGEKSLVNLLTQIDYDLYDVDLFLLNHDGVFMEYLPKEVNILSLSETYKVFSLPLPQSVFKFFITGKMSLALNRIIFTMKNKNSKNTSKSEQYSWKHLAFSLEKLEEKYDVAIGFLEKTATYFCVDKVNAKSKIGWVHIDYDQLGMDPKFDIHYFKRLNHIVTVSEECANIVRKRFPSEKHKVDVIYNIVSPTMINKMALEDSNNVYDKKDNKINILSIGRLHYQKGFEFAIEASKKLIEKGYNLKWSIIGEGEEQEKLSNLIKSYNLEKNFQLLGLKSNPYPYIKQADIYVQTSRFEGKSIAIDEAKIMHKPIVVTNFSTAKDQIISGVNGLIVDMDPNEIASGIEKIINKTGFKDSLINNLTKEKLGTEEEINKFYKILKR